MTDKNHAEVADEERIAELALRYTVAMHRMQTGVALLMNFDPKPTEPKHLRVGVNSAMSDQAALANLLIAKGIISRLEYAEAVAESAEQEAAHYEKKIREIYGDKISLG